MATLAKLITDLKAASGVLGAGQKLDSSGKKISTKMAGGTDDTLHLVPVVWAPSIGDRALTKEVNVIVKNLGQTSEDARWHSKPYPLHPAIPQAVSDEILADPNIERIDRIVEVHDDLLDELRYDVAVIKIITDRDGKKRRQVGTQQVVHYTDTNQWYLGANRQGEPNVTTFEERVRAKVDAEVSARANVESAEVDRLNQADRHAIVTAYMGDGSIRRFKIHEEGTEGSYTYSFTDITTATT